MQPPAGSFSLATDGRIGQPDRWHQRSDHAAAWSSPVGA
jgi:hypothetical protein